MGPESTPLPRGLAAWAWGQLRDSAVEGGPPSAADLGTEPSRQRGGEASARADPAFPRKLLLS